MMEDSKTRRNRQMIGRTMSSILVDLDIKKKNRKPPFVLDESAFSQGEKWFENGLSLEDASLELRENESFVKGFERGERLAKIAEYQTLEQKKINSSRK